jgi:DNA mismatch repair protein MSH4
VPYTLLYESLLSPLTTHRYYALSAACALFKYVEAKLNTCFAPGSLRIRYVPVEGTMMIDRETALNLELVGNMHSRKSTHSLFGTLNHTYTAMATRLLRVNILSPILGISLQYVVSQH